MYKWYYINFRGIVLLFFTFLVIPINSQEYNFRTLSSSEGLAQPYVYSIVQDSHGYLWIGTTDGLSRYNGFTINTFTTSDSLADNFVSSGIDDGNFLWFGHRTGRITFYNGKEFKPVNNKGRKLSPITNFAKSPDGQIWVSTLSDGLFKLGKGEIVFESNIFRNLLPIHSFAFINDNELLIGCGDGLWRGKINITSGSEETFPINEIPHSRVSVIQKTRDNSGYYIATENEGIYNLKINNQELRVVKIITEPAFEFTNVQSLCEDNQANIWIGSFINGIIKLVQGSDGTKRISFYNKASGFVTDNVLTIFEDREGNIWSGNYGDGLTQITPRIFEIKTFDIARLGNNIFAICSDPQNLWLGTEKGLIQTDQLTGKVKRFYGYGSGLPKDTVTAIYKSNENELWIGTDKNGLFRLNIENENIIKFPVGSGTLENSITAITGKDDQVWAGTKKGLCDINSATDNIIWYTINQGGLPHNSIVSLYLDTKNRLWASTKSTVIACLENGKVTKIPLSSGSGILTLGPVAEDTESRIWVGSRGNGVFIIDSDSVFYLTAKQGLISDYCYSLISDYNHNIWIGHKGGLSRIRTSDFSVKQVQQIDGVSGDYQLNQNAVCIDQNHRILFGSDRGLISYDPARELSKFVPPILGITSIKVNDEEIDRGKNKIVLSPGKYKIRIDFFGTSLKEPSQVTYQHQLNGYDQWSEITKSTSVTYNQLTYGEYEFILKASSGDGAVTLNPLTVSIIVNKPLWNKWWFWTGSVLLLALIILLYVKRRLNRLLAEKKLLEEKVLERTQEIQCQKNEIEEQSNMIEQKNKNITSSITYAGKIQDAVLPPVELMYALLPDSFLYHKPKDIVSGDFYWLKEKFEKIIFTVADCTGHGVPGAFMSLLGITILNEIVDVQGIIRSDIIVTTLRERIVQSLQQKRKDRITTDGMDIALCVLDRKQKKLQFSGAMNDLVLISEGKRTLLKSDHMDVSPADFNSRKFTLNEVDYKSGDMIYLFSDGYQDQFGGDFDKKFLRPHFYNLLFEMSPLPVNAQKEFLDKKLKDWMKDTPQTDDITVWGIRL